MLHKRLLGLLITVPLIVGLCVVAYRLGPNPVEKVDQTRTDLSPATRPEQAQPERSSAPQLFELLGMNQTAVGRGRIQGTPTEYLNSVEVIYRKRGYQKIENFDDPGKSTRKRHRVQVKERDFIKFFQRDDTGGVANISATGVDADHTSNEEMSEPYTFTSFVIAAPGGGADWMTYRITHDQSKIAQLAKLDNGDFPGVDPAGIPRLSGLQRIYVSTSGSASIAMYKSKDTTDSALMLRYLQEMSRSGWHLDSEATSSANKVVSGIMCFTQGGRSCLIWITPNKNDGTTNVTISSH